MAWWSIDLILVWGTILTCTGLYCGWKALTTAYSWWRERPVRKRLEALKDSAPRPTATIYLTLEDEEAVKYQREQIQEFFRPG